MSTSSDAQWLADTAANYKLSTESAENLAFSLPPLEAAHIVEFLGSGGYGTAYRLSNDHVLKVSVPGPDPDTGEWPGRRPQQRGAKAVGLTPHLKSQAAALKRLQNDQFAGRAKLRHVAVYDVGTGSFMNMFEEDDDPSWGIRAGDTVQNEFTYVELAHVQPLILWLDEQGISPRRIDRLWRMFKDGTGRHMNAGLLDRMIQRHRASHPEARVLRALLRSALDLTRTTGDIVHDDGRGGLVRSSDVTISNAGVLHTRGNKPVIVFFDF